MTIRLGNAPTSWGVERPSDPAQPPWELVLAECARAGYSGIELGPYGYLPTDPAALRSALDRHGLTLTGGNLMEPLHLPASRSGVLELARRTCALLRQLGARHLVVIAGLSAERVASAGRDRAAERLDSERFAELAGTVRAIAGIAGDHGIEPALHPHAGTHLEFRDEIERLAEALPERAWAWCVDTGHAAYAGIDPAALIADLGERLGYVHLKDVDPAVLDRARTQGLSFWEAYRAGVFCVPGRGACDFAAIRSALRKVGYQGWATVEQDADPAGGSRPLQDAVAGRGHLERSGFGA